MKLGVVTVTVGYWEGVKRLVESFYNFCPWEFEFFIIPNLLKERSLSSAWNLGISQALDAECDFIVVANDDAYLVDDESLEVIIRYMEDNNLWVCRTYPNVDSAWQKGYHFFIIRPEAIDEIGYFDEDFWPAYFEDDDWHYRSIMIDPSKTDVIMVNIPHEELRTLASMTFDERLKFRDHLEANEARYANKWGGPPGKERYRIPYQEYKEEHPSFGISLEGITVLDTEAEPLE